MDSKHDAQPKVEEKKLILKDVSNADLLLSSTALRDAFSHRQIVPDMREWQVRYHHTYNSDTWNLIYTLVLCVYILLVLVSFDGGSTSYAVFYVIEYVCLLFFLVDLGIYWAFNQQTLGNPNAPSKAWIYASHVLIISSIIGATMGFSRHVGPVPETPVPSSIIFLEAMLRAIRPCIAICRKRSLRRMVSFLVSGLPGLLKMVLVMSVYIAYCMLLGYEMFRQDLPDDFGTVTRALYTVFMCLVAGSYQTGVYSRAIATASAVYVPVFFLLMTIAGCLLLFKLLVGIATRGFQLASGQAVKSDKACKDANLVLAFKKISAVDAEVYDASRHGVTRDNLIRLVNSYHKHAHASLGESMIRAIEIDGQIDVWDFDHFVTLSKLLEIGWRHESNDQEASPLRLRLQRYLRAAFHITIPKCLIKGCFCCKKEENKSKLDPEGIYFQHSKHQVNLVQIRQKKLAEKKAASEADPEAPLRVRVEYSRVIMAGAVMLSMFQLYTMALRLNNGDEESPLDIALTWVVFIVFLVEAVVKCYAYGPAEYWSDGWHKLDILCLLGNCMDLFFVATPTTQTLANTSLAVRSLRVMELLLLIDRFAVMMNTISLTLTSITPFVFLYFSFVYFFGVVGVWAFGDTLVSYTDIPELQATKWFTTLGNMINFDSPLRAMVGVFYIGLHGGWWRLLDAVDVVYTNYQIGRFFFIFYRLMNYMIMLPCFFGFVLQVWGTCSPISARAFMVEKQLDQDLWEEDQRRLKAQRLAADDSETQGLRDSEVASDEKETAALTSRESGNHLYMRRRSTSKAIAITKFINSKTNKLSGEILNRMKQFNFNSLGKASSREVMRMGYQSVMDTVNAQRAYEIEEKLADAKLMRAFLQDLLKERKRLVSVYL